MFVSRVSAASLSSQRLDSDFYRPEYLRNEEKLLAKKVGKLGDVGHFFAGPFGSLLPSNLYLDKGVPLFRVGNVGQFEVLTDNFAHLAPHVHDDLKTSEVRPGDLLVVKASVGEKICKVPDWIPKANITQHIIGIRPNDTFDTDYVSAFLFSRFGVLQLQRYSLGSIIQYLGITDAKGTYIVKAEPVAQKYIGDKVRQAERLRAWAKLAESHVNQYHQALVPQQAGLDFTKRVRVVSPARMSERLDAHFYPGVVDEYLRLHQGKFKPLGKLCATIYNGQTQPETDSSQSCKQITVANLSSSFLGGSPRDVEAPGKKEKFLKAYDILMCNAAHNKSYIGKDLTFVHSEAAILPSTEVMTIRVDRNQVPASYVRAYLLTKLGYVQIQSTIRGITAHSYPDDMALLDIFVPNVADKDKEEWFACDEKLALAGKACEVATQLTNAAKLLVEALIECQLTEAELIAAEQALQAGNDQNDRRILNRLKTDGVDGQGPALFGDLDELYHLLTQAEGD
jgi:type I restriction enzyme S subunit